MGHTKPEQLKDLQPVLNEIRNWENIKEKSPNIFYYNSKPFLHFHDKDGKRWADVRDGDSWGKPLEIDFGSTSAKKDAFLKAVKKRYLKLLKPQKA